MYSSPIELLMNQTGLDRLQFWNRPEYEEFKALDDITLEIGKGERVGLLGRNGAGKTTLLKLLTGNFTPTDGIVKVSGGVQALMATGFGFHPEFTGMQNIEASIQYNGLAGQEMIDAIDDVIDFVELDEFIHQPIKTYSAGMQARLMFATATAIQPDILIIDEILGAGDAYFTTKSAMRMEKLANSGCTLLLVSHTMPQILQFCDRAIWIENGKIKEDGSVRDIVGMYEVFIQQKSEHLPKEENGIGKSLRLKLNASPDFATSDEYPKSSAQDGEFLDHLLNGQAVFRWPGDLGAKLEDFGLYVKNKRVNSIMQNADVELRFTVRFEVDSPFNCIFQISIFTIENRRATNIVSSIYAYDGKAGNSRAVKAILEPCLLGVGDYYFNFAILPEDAMRTGVALRRYDLVSRFCDFEIRSIMDYREPPIFTHPSKWVFEN